jgi:hypothetical protein
VSRDIILSVQCSAMQQTRVLDGSPSEAFLISGLKKNFLLLWNHAYIRPNQIQTAPKFVWSALILSLKLTYNTSNEMKYWWTLVGRECQLPAPAALLYPTADQQLAELQDGTGGRDSVIGNNINVMVLFLSCTLSIYRSAGKKITDNKLKTTWKKEVAVWFMALHRCLWGTE